LEGLAKPYNPQDWIDEEWTGTLDIRGQRRFRIRYYGELFEGLIVGTEDAPQLVYGEDESTGELFLLFDGCSHGYNAML
jgi:hypothetical protein